MPTSRRLMPLIAAVATVAPLLCAASVSASPADGPAPDPTASATPTVTATPSPSPTTTPAPTATTTTPTSTPTPTPTDTVTPQPKRPIVVSRGNYAPNPADTIRTYAPSGPGPYPAVLFIHGGAWGRALPNVYEFRFAHRLAASQQWVVAVIGYPTKIPHERTVEPHAIRTALEHLARRDDVDPHAIALWGESSGGQLALLAAYRDAMNPTRLVDAVVSISGPTNMRIEFSSLAETALGAVLRFEGLSPRQAAARGSSRYRLTSPVSIVRSRDPATFQAISLHDPLVPPVQVSELTARLAAEHVSHQTVHVRGNGHSTTIENERPIGYTDDVESLAAAFLTRAFAAAG
ncbi:MAG TPA: alpha/beta hydrolase [Mycobacteriales bacterium]|nr:alpha/beta hydrolase [Mycobacteriales bacterium]